MLEPILYALTFAVSSAFVWFVKNSLLDKAWAMENKALGEDGCADGVSKTKEGSE